MLGRLNFAGRFVPDFKRRVRPLIRLLSADGGDQWKPEHTEVLNEIMALVYSRVQLGLVDPSKPIRFYIDADDTDCSAVMT